ncbi:MAG TPA: cation:proton antiporter, partial [Acidimicrobiales bacterium]|nr:cation:proton antiporter [Acidimicrobiales bacterium]
RLGGWLFARLRQPPVIGEVVGGLLLGPTILGAWSTELFPLDTRPLLRMLATVGLVLFMFVIGLELDHAHVRGRTRLAGSVAVAGTVVPFALGVGLALLLASSYPNGDTLAFTLFMGAAMSITAFPVLARILKERDLYTRPLGGLAMACAAGDDVLTWITLALVVAMATSAGAGSFAVTVVLSVVFCAGMVKVVRPRLARFEDAELTPTAFALVMIGILVSSFVTSAIGIHEIFGAFLFGAVFPRGALAQRLRDRLASMTLVLLPVFFVTTGLGVDVSGLPGDAWWQLAAILVVAVVGKFAGGIIGARTQGLRMRESAALGALMNTRGLTELVVLNIGHDLGVIDDHLFTMLVVMAVVTTVATGPLLDLIRPDPDLGAKPAPDPDAVTEDEQEDTVDPPSEAGP